jgi:hypothetical protein
MLIRTGVHWSFESERALEDIVADHLQPLLSLNLLHRQYLCQGEICDLVATNADHQLVIYEYGEPLTPTQIDRIAFEQGVKVSSGVCCWNWFDASSPCA